MRALNFMLYKTANKINSYSTKEALSDILSTTLKRASVIFAINNKIDGYET